MPIGGSRNRLRKKLGDKKKPAKPFKKSSGGYKFISFGDTPKLKGVGKRQRKKGGVRRDNRYRIDGCTGKSVRVKR